MSLLKKSSIRILSITAQRPDSTGSGVYLTQLVRALDKKGYEQAVIAGIENKDTILFPAQVKFYPVRFETETLPFPIVGMSDEMPYPSTRYRDLTPKMVQQYREAFRLVLEKAVEEFDPELILCHHLYLLTAMVRELFPEKKVYGFCHNTDLMQMKNTDLERVYIAKEIRKLDRIFVLREDQIPEIEAIYGAQKERILPIGTGYNKEVFFSGKRTNKDDSEEMPSDTNQGAIILVFTGKLTQRKGLLSLLRALSYLSVEPGKLRLICAGATGNEVEYQAVRALADASPYEVVFYGMLDEKKLADVLREGDIFVLPSFYEGIPISVIEALACGNRVILTELPGLRAWFSKYISGAPISYVPYPAESEPEKKKELPAFERELAKVIEKEIATVKNRKLNGESEEGAIPDLSCVTWEGVAKRVLHSS